MPHFKYGSLSLIFLASVILFCFSQVSAQEETYTIAHQDTFKTLKRPAVNFPHSLHEEALEANGCGACHHALDPADNKLKYTEGEEQECNGCHGIAKAKTKYALREAFHKSCTGCHRKTKKNSPPKAGPTTCGECHKKQNVKQD